MSDIHSHMETHELRVHLQDKHGMNTDWSAKYNEPERGRKLNVEHNRAHQHAPGMPGAGHSH